MLLLLFEVLSKCIRLGLSLVSVVRSVSSVLAFSESALIVSYSKVSLSLSFEGFNLAVFGMSETVR